MEHKITPIGLIRSPFKTKDECPIQSVYSSKARGSITLYRKYENGLKDIETFSHIYVLYLFDRTGKVKLVRPTFLDDEPHGIFASRHPCRPNGIGISIVKLLRRDGPVLEIEGVDVLDRTPLVDIKPYIPRFDIIESASEGWVADVSLRPKPKGRE